MGMSPVMSGFASNDLQSKSTPERVAAAAKEFEAVLIEQMLKEARTCSGLSEEQDQASATLRETRSAGPVRSKSPGSHRDRSRR